MGASPSSPEDIAKALLLQAALARKGVSPKAIADAINKLTRCTAVDKFDHFKDNYKFNQTYFLRLMRDGRLEPFEF